MSRPIVLINNLVTEETVNGGGVVEPGSTVDSTATPFTYDVCISPGPSLSITVTLASAQPADCVGFLGAYNGGDGFTLQGRNGGAGAWTDVLDLSSIQQGATLRSFAQATYEQWRFNFWGDGSSNVDLRVANISLGIATEFERCIMKSHAPITYNRVTQYTTNESGTGQFLGRSIVRQNQATDVEFSMITAPWARNQLQDFVRHAQKKPFYFAWNPTDYPDEVGYVWTDEDIGVEYTGDGSLMTASWRMKGISRYES